MQTKNFDPISFVEDMCICNEEGNVAIFPNFQSAVDYREKHEIDGKVIEIPVYS